MIKEVIVVEGNDDIRAVKSAVECEIIQTHGFGYGKKFIETLKNIDKRCGIIIFTDPDYMGNKIRQDLAKHIPNAKHAFLPQNKAKKKNNIGVENATSEDIRFAIENAKPSHKSARKEFTNADLLKNGLSSKPGSDERRAKLGAILGIGHGNSKQFLNRLNSFEITRAEFEDALRKLDGKTL